VPIYEYRCLDKNEIFEAIQSPREAVLESCPSCGGKVEKMVSLGSFQLKGTGWYSTDYKSSASKVEKKTTEGSSGSSSSAKAEASSSIKPSEAKASDANQ
jgi:putative FmdB family regulatory protein